MGLDKAQIVIALRCVVVMAAGSLVMALSWYVDIGFLLEISRAYCGDGVGVC